MLLDAKCEQDVTRDLPTSPPVTRRHVQNAINHNRTGPVDGAAVRRNAIHRLELTIRIEFPEQRSVLRRVCADAAIGGS